MAEDELINKGSQVAARGTVQLLIGRVYFMAAGYVIAVVLARGLGPVAYGTYGLIMSVLLWLEVASDFGIQRATMKLIPQSDDARAIARTSAACLLAVSTSLFIVCWIAAPAIARSFNIDDGEWLIRLAIFDIPLNGLYIAYQGIMQGHRRFGAISLAMIFYSTAKLGGTLLLLVIGLSVELALVVNVLATVAALLFLATQYRPGISFASRSVVNSIVRVAAPDRTVHRGESPGNVITPVVSKMARGCPGRDSWLVCCRLDSRATADHGHVRHNRGLVGLDFWCARKGGFRPCPNVSAVGRSFRRSCGVTDVRAWRARRQAHNGINLFDGILGRRTLSGTAALFVRLICAARYTDARHARCRSTSSGCAGPDHAHSGRTGV